MGLHWRRSAAVTSGVVLLGLVLPAAAAGAVPADQPWHDISLDGLPADDRLLAELAGSDIGAPLPLITGDLLVVGVDGDGEPVVRDIVAAPRERGTQVVFYTLTRGDQVYVLPSDALPLVGAGVLDWELFNPAKLAAHAAQGTVDELPVIVTYDGAVAAQRAPAQVDGATVEHALPSINGTAVTIEAGGDWWRQVQDSAAGTPPARAATATGAGPLAGVAKVWLDELAEIQLDESVPQVGAPSAWESGLDGTGVTVAVLDTGIDADHPDVAGKIVEAVDFTGAAPGAVDGHGHGTHVAATIAGTGAASGGLRPGVAPGADLLIGKVCNDEGQCPTSGIIAGMEWAASAGAQVVNLSLGGDATDGTDPESMAINALSDQYGTLYVSSAGNSGPGPYTVGSPAAADAALAVAAVDKSGAMAGFSSRGPRVGDETPKPDIAAPGVGIVAARAAGTEMGTVVDDLYTAASGTSMASPHVAGGAAIVAQQHPDLSGQEIKALLMETAVDLGHDRYAQGAGRMDLAGAAAATVFAGDQVTFGRLPYPHQPATEPARLVNVTDQPITLSLVAEFSDGQGDPAPAGLFTVDAEEVTVPAGGAVTFDVDVDGRVLASDGRYGWYRGRVAAYDGAGTQRAEVDVWAYLEPERFEVDVDIAGAEPSARYGNLLIVPMDDQTNLHTGLATTIPSGEHTTADLFAGTYAIAVEVRWSVDGVEQTALLMDPEVVVEGDRSVALDLADAGRFAVDVPEQTDLYSATVDLERTSATGAWGLTASLDNDYPGSGPERIEPNWWLLPTDPPDTGTFTVSANAVLVPALTTLRVVGGGPRFALDSRYANVEVSTDGGIQGWPVGESLDGRGIRQPLPRLTADGAVPVVYAGTGTAEDLAAADVAGKLVLLTATDICGTVTCPYNALRERVEAAADLGAMAALVAGRNGLVHPPEPPAELDQCLLGPDSCPPVEPYSSIPVLGVPAAGAAEVIDRLATEDDVNILVGGDGQLSEAYALAFRDDRVPSMPYQVGPERLHRTDHRIHDRAPGEVKILEWARFSTRTGELLTKVELPRVATPAAFTLYVLEPPAGTLDQFQVGVEEFTGTYLVALTAPEMNSPVAIAAGERRLVNLAESASTFTWNSGPQVPGASSVAIGETSGWLTPGACSGCRQGNTLWPTIHLTTSDGLPTTSQAGLLDDTGGGVWFFNTNGCVECDIELRDAGGQVLDSTLTEVSITDPVEPVAPPSADWWTQFGLTNQEVTR